MSHLSFVSSGFRKAIEDFSLGVLLHTADFSCAMARLLPVLALVASCSAMYDVLVDYYAPPALCQDGCALWSDLAADNCTRAQADVNAKVSRALDWHQRCRSYVFELCPVLQGSP